MVKVYLSTDGNISSFGFPNATEFDTNPDGQTLRVYRRDGDKMVHIARFASGWLFAEIAEEEAVEGETAIESKVWID